MKNHSPCCQLCGAELPANARSCKRCGSSDDDGWSDHAHEGDLDDNLDDDFDYDEFIENEFPEGQRSTSLHPLWKGVVFVLLALFVILTLMQL